MEESLRVRDLLEYEVFAGGGRKVMVERDGAGLIPKFRMTR